MLKVKFLKNGIKHDNKYYPASYRKDKWLNQTDCQLGVTIYAKSLICGLPKILEPENNTDITTDYVESDSIFIPVNKFCENLKKIYEFLAEKEKKEKEVFDAEFEKWKRDLKSGFRIIKK